MQRALALAVLGTASGFYLPGVAPRDYEDGETVDLKVNAVNSPRTHLPFDYYMFKFCPPEKIEDKRENLGEILEGNIVRNSPYEIFMRQSESCKVLCKSELDEHDLKLFKHIVAQDYRVDWIVDNLPAATMLYTVAEKDDPVEFTEDGVDWTQRYEKGFDVGFVGSDTIPHTYEGQAYINNHHHITLFYHAVEEGSPEMRPASSGDDEDDLSADSVLDPDSTYRIVGFEVIPYSVKHQVKGDYRGKDTKLDTCNSKNPVTRGMPPQALSSTDNQIIFTYDIEWKQSDVKWASRWDLYLKMPDSQIHWFSIANSLIIVVFLAAIVALILVRTLNRDLRKYNEILEMTEEEQQEETGWKLIHGDVFRPPTNGGLLATLTGTGCQLLSMSCLTLIFAAAGVLSPSNRGGLMTAFLLIFVFLGCVAGYQSTRIYLMFKLDNWKKNSIMTAMLVPSIFFAVFFILNLFIWGEKSSGAVKFSTMLALVALWLCISLPLVYVGSHIAAQMDPLEPPLRVNNIPRVVETEYEWYNGPVASAMLSSILPFGAIFIELYFIMTSIWMQQFYYVFGFLLIVFVVMVITCAEVSICLCYFQLCAEDYHWWWRSFLNSGCSAFYLFLYSIFYYTFYLHIDFFVPSLLYFGYMLLFSFAFFIMTGTIGFLASYYFVRKIYMSIKID